MEIVTPRMCYEDYAAFAPPGKLDLVLDADGVELHLGKIADATDDWETVLAPYMGLTDREVKDIRKDHKDQRAVQRREILRLWKSKFGSEATYGNLMKICIDHGNGHCATVISKLWSESEKQSMATPSVSAQNFNIGMVLQLKQETPEYKALKKYEDELIESLRSANMLAIVGSAAERNLVPNELTANIRCLDPSIHWPHPLICRFLFHHVYTTMQAPSLTLAVVEPFQKWLGLLSGLKIMEVDGVLSRIKQYHMSLEKVLVSRALPYKFGVTGTITLNTRDSTLLAEVLLEFSEKWKEVACSLPLSNSDIEMIQNMGKSKNPLDQFFSTWKSLKLSGAKPPTLENLKKVLCGNIVGLKKDTDIERDFRFYGVTYFSDISRLTTAKEYTQRWKEIAYAILLPKRVESLIDLTNATASQLANLLTMWILNKFPNARPPTFENLVKSLNHDEAAQFKERLVRASMLSSKKTGLESNVKTMISPSLSLKIKEGSSVLLEAQVSNFFEVPNSHDVTFEWFHDKELMHKCGITMKSYANSSFTSILHFPVNDLSAEGAYKCVLKSSKKSLTFPLIFVSCLTPVCGYKNVLTNFYTVQPEVPEDTWPPVSSNSYISLALIKQEGICAGEYGRSTIRGDVDDIYHDKEGITYANAFNNLESGTRLLVEGRPGSGKTTLVHKISKDWGIGQLKFLHNRLLFLVHLRAFSSDPNVGLYDILKSYFNTDSSLSTIAEYAEKHNGLGLCFILDGLDEYMPKNNYTFIFRLIKKQVFPNASVIVASRPAAAANFRKQATRQVEVIGFLKEHIYDYIKKYPFSEETKCDELSTFFGQHPNVLHTCYLPIHSAMVCFLFDVLGRDLPKTETEIYEEFTKYTILRTLYRNKDGSQSYIIESIDNLDSQRKILYAEICKLAFEMTTLSKQVMKQVELQSFLKEDKDSLGLVTVDRMATKLGFQNMYTFLHLTFQEFLAASYISSLEETKQMELITTYAKEKQMQQVWKFYCGLVKFTDSCDKFKALISNSEYGSLYKVQCCFESQQPHLCDVAVVNNTLSFTETFLSSSNFTEIAYVISHSRQVPVQMLSFDGTTFGEEEVDILTSRTGDRLTALCHYRCDTKQLAVVNYLLHKLPSLKLLDISNSNLGMEEISVLVKDLNHLNLELIKVGYRGCELYSSPNMQQKLARDFMSKCSKFSNICFSSIGDMHVSKETWPLPFYFHCNPPCVTINCNELNLSGCRALSNELMTNPHYTRVTLSDCGIDDESASFLSLGLKCCINLQALDLSFNNISNAGAGKIGESIKHCSQLGLLDMSFNRIDDEGAMALVQSLANIEGLKLLLNSGDISRFDDVFQLHRDVEFHTITLSGRDLEDPGAAMLASSIQSLRRCEDILQFHGEKNGISIAGLRPLCDVLGHCNNLLVLNLSSNNIGSDGAVTLAATLKQCTKLHKLDVSSNYLCSQGATAIAEGLSHCSFLLELKISSNHIGSDGAKALAEALKHCTILQDLVIHSNNIMCEGVEALADSVKCWTNFFSLDISSNSIGSKGAEALASALKQIPSFRELYAGNNKIQDEGLICLASALQNCGTSLSALDVSSNNITITGLKAFTGILKSCREFDVSNNDLGQEGVDFLIHNCKKLRHIAVSHINAMSLTGMIQSYQRLYKLDISNNALTKVCWQDLVTNSLKLCIHLQELNVSNTEMFGSDFIKSFSDSLIQLPNLRVLSVSFNSIGDDNAAVLARGLEHCDKLQVLNVDHNRIGSKGAEALADAINVSKVLQKLNISNNDIFEDGEKPLCYVLEQCIAIRDLDFSFTEISSVYLAESLKRYANLETLRISFTKVSVANLAAGLKYCRSLRELYMGSIDKIEPSGVKALADLFSNHCKKLHTLDISGNYLTTRDIKVLCKALLHCKTLSYLYMNSNNLRMDGIETLSYFIKHCCMLQMLALSDNPIDQSSARLLANALQHPCGRLVFNSDTIEASGTN